VILRGRRCRPPAPEECHTEWVPLDARLYLVTGAIEDDRLDAALGGGVDIVQLRLKDADDEAILTQAARTRAVCRRHGVPFLLNDRPDLVRAAGADGVHLGQEDMPVAEARALLGPGAIIGLSTHTPAQVDAAGGLAIDYFAVGPIHATPTKPGRPAVGEALIRHAAARASLPFFAIGGIDTVTVAAATAAGARAVAVIRAITEAPDPRAAAAALAAALEAADEPA
jgi:thiamine-phosphate pyrophosphorylase